MVIINLIKNSLLHPMSLVVGTKGNTAEQDGLVKFDSYIVPEWTKRVPVLKMKQNHPCQVNETVTTN